MLTNSQIIEATLETFRGPVLGLGDPQSNTVIGAALPQERYGLVKQYTHEIAVFGFLPAEGTLVESLRIDPPPGLYNETLYVSFSPSNDTYYRTSAEAGWTLFSDPFPVIEETTVQFYAGDPVRKRPPLKARPICRRRFR